jgi:ABC-type sugar transport system permease subunit
MALSPDLSVPAALMLVLIFIGYPVVDSVIASLTRWDGIGKARFVGLDTKRGHGGRARYRDL